MVNIKQLKSKIATIKSLQKIIGALEVASTAKLHKLKNQTVFFKEFFYEFLYVLNYVQKQIDIFDSAFQQVDDNAKRLLVVISTDKGLAGGSNANLFKRIVQSYGTRKDKVDILAIGKKGKEFFERNGRNVIASLQIKDKIIAGELVELYNFLRNATDEKQYSRIKIYFNFFKNALVQRPTRFSLFPLNQENLDAFNEEIELKTPINRREYREMIIEPDEETYKETIIQEIIENMIYYSVVNAKMSEHAARMIAMKNSKDNCKELETKLNSTYNKSRQMKITQEISEIVGTKSAIEQ